MRRGSIPFGSTFADVEYSEENTMSINFKKKGKSVHFDTTESCETPLSLYGHGHPKMQVMVDSKVGWDRTKKQEAELKGRGVPSHRLPI